MRLKKWNLLYYLSSIRRQKFICRNDQFELRIHSMCLYVNENPLVTTVHFRANCIRSCSLSRQLRSFSRKHLQAPWLPRRCHHTSSESTNWEFPVHSFEVSQNSQRSNSSKMCRTKVYHIKRHSQLHDKRSLLVSIPTSLIYCCFGDGYVLCEWTFPGKFGSCGFDGFFWG